MCHPGIEREMIIDEDTSQVIPTLSTVRKAHRLMDPVQLDPSTLTPLSKSKKAKTFSKKDRWVLKYRGGVSTPKNPKNPKLVGNPILGLGFFGFFWVFWVL